MKTLLHIFYDILLKIRVLKSKKNLINKRLITKYFEPSISDEIQLTDSLVSYLENFYYFCFELENNNMLKGQINFKYKY